jgi:RHS repeat-associated protein
MLSAGTSTKFLVQVIGTELDMDRFIYNYHTLNGEQSNRLNYVVDNGIDYSSYDDIKSGQTSGNYTYNKIGELVSDNSENMILHWRTGDHKLAKIERTDENSSELEFVYSPFGQRVMKIEKIRANGVLTGEVKNSYYAYDANSLSRCIHSSLTLFRRSNVTIGSQVMAIYEINLDNEIYKLKERNIYGAERLGANNTEVTIFENNTLTEFIHKETNVVHVDIRGRKRYFLTNHLGTVNATITDRKIYNTTDHYYEPVIVMYAETYCFGFLMPNRSFNLEESRYLLHGMEYDSEVSGTGNSYTTEFRQFDPRLGRWKSLDPLMHMFPWMSPYVAFDNNPVYYNDPLGLAAEGGGEPIKKEGNRHFTDKKATESELKDLPGNPANQETVVFEYDNAVVTYKYVDNHPNQNGIDGYWDAHVRGTTVAGGDNSFPVSKKAVVIAKAVPPSTELNNGNGGIDIISDDYSSQAGQETNSSSNTSGSSSSGSGNPPRNPPPPPRRLPPPPHNPPLPPDCFGFDRGTNLNLNIGFQFDQSRLRNENATRPVMRAVADVILANPWSFINLTYNFRISNGSWDALNPNSGPPAVTNDVIGRNRANRLRSMLIEFGVQPNRIGVIRGDINGGASVDGVIFRRIQIPCD